MQLIQLEDMFPEVPFLTLQQMYDDCENDTDRMLDVLNGAAGAGGESHTGNGGMCSTAGAGAAGTGAGSKWIQLYDGLFIVMNKIGVVLSWKLCKGTTLHKIVSKLRLALQHKYQLAIQQTAEVGELRCVTMKMGREEGQDNSQDDLRRRPQIMDILDDNVKIDPDSGSPLQGAQYTRLNHVDALELFAVHYVRNEANNNVFKGHLSLLGLMFLDLFVFKGTALFVYQLTKDGRRKPKDFYGRPLKEYWFKFTASPTDRELRILDEVMRMSSNLDLEEKQVLLSAFNPKLASEAMPFYLNLNALLVISGNCHIFTKY
ncbi:hypothetical protein ACROYT_G014601 [Oculina patagonica]